MSGQDSQVVERGGEIDIRVPTRLARLTAGNVKTAADLTVRIREMQDHAFVLSPMTEIAAIAPSYEITPVLVVIDPSVDAETGRGADVYHQSSIHKREKVAGKWQPIEVSLNHYGLLRILGAVGVNVYPTRWMADGMTERYLWVCETDGDLIDFTGQVRRLPTGIGSLDARDGAPDIGEWTPVEWAKRVDVANKQRAMTPKEDQWKIRPEPINGWTAERVIQVRKYGRQLAKTKSLNGLARKLGVRQTYTIAELTRKPFVIMRPMFMPDLSNPRIAEMITAANLGARNLLYPGSAALQEAPIAGDAAPVSHGHGDPHETIAGEVISPEAPERMQTDAAPEDTEEVVFDAPKQVPAADDVYHVSVVKCRGKGADAQYFVETTEGVAFYTTDADLMKSCHAASKDRLPREIASERVMVAGKAYRQILELRTHLATVLTADKL